ncbi:hypothetical protein, partial [Vibrio crassostreae]|uniref:hypothetical protein n=1 Tax=Vibrio crassostreae TaxID=246167 RepID=UPI0010DFAB27
WSSKEVTHTVVTVKPMRVTPAELGVYQCLISYALFFKQLEKIALSTSLKNIVLFSKFNHLSIYEFYL